MSSVSHWMYVDVFTVNQAAALWCGVDPARLSAVESFWPSEVFAAKQMLVSAIVSMQLAADDSTNALSMIGDHSKTHVSREDLANFAKGKCLFPTFLFDTISPFQDPENPTERLHRLVAGSGARVDPSPQPVPEVSDKANTQQSRVGRPPEYDWDSFFLEIVHRANSIDGLPEKQADLVREMLSWFGNTHEKEPAESAVKARVSKIFRYLDKAKNPSE
ncbi:MAG: hypothetical protein KL863_02425 [Rhizobium sp.]|nr:hypothetical protein [Rhizobium sp.]